MLHHLFCGLLKQSRVARVVDTLLLSQQSEGGGPNLLTGLARFHPLEFARATNGFVYMADGLHGVTKWDGIKREPIVVGVAAPATAVTAAVSGDGAITGTYNAYVRFYDDEGNVSNLSPVSDDVVADENATFTYTGIPESTDPKVIGRQILRNTAGQYLVYYVDVDSEDLTATSLSSSLTDALLRNQSAVPLFNFETAIPTELANRNGVPPNDKHLIAYYQNRLWLYGEVVYTTGHASVTFGSTSVTGVGTQWTAEMADRYLYISSERKSYLISSVAETTQTITLDTEYLGATDLFCEYKIRPTPSRRHVLAYSEPGRFDSWPAAQNLVVASSDDIDDDPAGLVSTQSFLYIVQRRHIYRMTFLDDPNVDGGIFLAARRGCINNRCWVCVDGFVYALDDRGIYKFDGGDATEDISQPIQDLFYFDRDPGELRINWRAARFFHAAHDRHDATIRWFVSLSGDYLPRHAICFNYSTPQWWIEEYPWACGDSTILKSDGAPPIVAGPHSKVLAMQVGTLDIVDPNQGDTRGVISAVTRTSITAPTTMQLPSTGVVGAPVSIISGAGKGQTRIVTQVSSRVISVDRPWMTMPAVDGASDESQFQLGAMPWKWKSGWAEWPIKEHNQPRKISVGFQPSRTPNQMDLRVYQDYAKTPNNAELTWPRNPSESVGIKTTKDSPDAEINLEQARGYAQLTVDSFAMFDADREDIISVELAGFSGQSQLVIYQISIFGAVEK